MPDPQQIREKQYRITAFLLAGLCQIVLIYYVASGHLPLGSERILYILDTRVTILALHALLLLYLILSFLKGISADEGNSHGDLLAGIVLALDTTILLYFHNSLPVHLSLLLTAALIILERYPYTHQVILISTLCLLRIVIGSIQMELEIAATVLLFWIAALFTYSVLHARSKRYEELADRSEKALWSATEFVKANAKLQYSAAMSNEKGRQSERDRLAREIHDTVGHSLTAILMQVRMLKHVISDHSSGNSAADKETQSIEYALIDTIADVRREVSMLRETPAVQINWLIRWRSLCRNFMESTGVSLIINIPDIETEPSGEIGPTVFRIMQEAFTNAVRHGKATAIDVTAMYKADIKQLYLRISDNGIGARKIVVGNGLSGIQERVSGLQGEVSWQTMPGKGFDLGVSLPYGER